MSDPLMRIVTLLLLVLFVPSQDKGLRKLEWKLPPGHAAEFVFLDKAGKPLPDQKFLIFGSELSGHSNRIVVDTYEEIPLPLLFQLPPEPFKTGVGWEYSATFFADSMDAMGGFEAMIGGGSIRPVCAKGRYILKTSKKGDEETATIDGAFSLYEIRREFINNQSKMTVTKNEMGTLATSAQFSLSKGMIVKAGWQFRTRGQERENGRPVEKKIETHGLIEFREDLELDPAKIQASLATSISRAVDWLKKQQKNGAWTPTRGTPTPSDTVHLTALVVRALVAAGVKPDDPGARRRLQDAALARASGECDPLPANPRPLRQVAHAGRGGRRPTPRRGAPSTPRPPGRRLGSGNGPQRHPQPDPDGACA
jgi:hypothetical protein